MAKKKMNEEDDIQEVETASTPSTPEQQPITFTIFETIVCGAHIFHPGQERDLLNANLPPGDIATFKKLGSIRGDYPKFESIERATSPINFGTGN